MSKMSRTLPLQFADRYLETAVGSGTVVRHALPDSNRRINASMPTTQ